MLMLLAVAGAYACGGLFAEHDTRVFSDAQLVLFEPGDGYVDVEYSIAYGGDASAFGWVIPVPGTFVSLEEGDPATML